MVCHQGAQFNFLFKYLFKCFIETNQFIHQVGGGNVAMEWEICKIGCPISEREQGEEINLNKKASYMIGYRDMQECQWRQVHLPIHL